MELKVGDKFRTSSSACYCHVVVAVDNDKVHTISGSIPYSFSNTDTFKKSIVMLDKETEISFITKMIIHNLIQSNYGNKM